MLTFDEIKRDKHQKPMQQRNFKNMKKKKCHKNGTTSMIHENGTKERDKFKKVVR